jgi:hypothetical protein
MLNGWMGVKVLGPLGRQLCQTERVFTTPAMTVQAEAGVLLLGCLGHLVSGVSVR